jgi:hypothetical protein
MIKKLKILSVITLFTGAILFAVSPSPQTSKIIHGSTVGKYKKPGAPVDIRYTVQKVQSDQPSLITVHLLTQIRSGTMHINLKTDKDLNLLEDFKTQHHFVLDGSKEYLMAFKVAAPTEGVFYIHLEVQMEKRGFRVFAIPVQIGEGKRQLNQKPLLKDHHGENISVSSAQEKITRH